MTTLPQQTTTGLRLPRAGGSSQLGTMTGGVPALATVAPPPSAGGSQMTASDVWRVLRANLWLILLLVGGCAFGGYWLNDYWARNRPTYTAFGTVQVLPPQTGNPLGESHIYGQGELLVIQQNTEAQRFRSTSLAEDLLRDPENPIRKTTWFTRTCHGDREEAQQLIREQLTASPQPESQLISVGMTAPDPGDAVVIVEEVVERAMRDQKEFVRTKYQIDEKRIGDVQAQAESALGEAQDSLDRATHELIQLGGTPGSSVSPNQILLARAVDRQTVAGTAAYNAKNAYDDAVAIRARGDTPPPIKVLVDDDPEVRKYKTMIDEINLRIALSGGENDGNPQVVGLKEQLSKLDRQYRSAVADKTDQYSTSYMATAKTTLENTAAEYARAQEEVKNLTTVNVQIGEAAEKRQNLLVKVQHLESEVNVDRQSKQNIQQMMRQAELGLMNWFAKPQPPSSPSFPKLAQTMTGAIVVGLVLSLGIAFLRELTDTSVRSPRDIVRVGQMSLLGMIPHENDDPQVSGARLPLVIYEAPTSIMAERLREVRTRLQHTASLDTTRSILVTSPGPGDGKTMVAANLAAGLALNGRRILLVDANFRRPELHKLFGLDNAIGFGNALSDTSAFSSAVRESSVPNLSVMTSGTKPGNATELLESQLLVDFTERALEEFDHVIFDSGPMLVVSESGALAPRVDGVITVVRARASSRGVLQRMRDGLRTVKAEHLGVVLNGVRTHAGGYYAGTIKTYYKYQNAN